MAEITQRTIAANGINIRIAEAGTGPVVLMIHGFPESWYSWRHQLKALADAGYHAVAPDVRGYGGTDAPEPIEAYAMREIVADQVGTLDALGAKTATVFGHDWGAPIAYNCALLAPDRFTAVGGLSVPFTGRAPMKPTTLMKAMFGDTFFYILYFQEPGVAEAELEADVARSMRLFMYAASGDMPRPAADDATFWQKKKGAKFLDGLPEPEKLPAWLSQEDLDYYVGEFTRKGFRGPLNRYRNIDGDWELLPELQGAKLEQPSVFIAGEADGVLVMNPTGIETMKQNAPKLTKVVLVPKFGHWVQQEAPEATSAAMIEFLKGLPS